MPLSAFIKSLGKIVDIEDCQDPRSEFSPGDVVCQMPDCGQPMFVRAADSEYVRPHFCHYTAECSSKYGSHPESAEHRAGKRAIVAYLRQKFASMGMHGVDVSLEVPVNCPPNGRKADVLASFPSGWRVVHEFQLSIISVGEIQARTASYAAVGMDCVWWIGEGSDADGHGIREWLLRTYGEVRVVPRLLVGTQGFDLPAPAGRPCGPSGGKSPATGAAGGGKG